MGNATDRHFLIEIAAIAMYESNARYYEAMLPWSLTSHIDRDYWRRKTDMLIQRELPK